MKIFNGHNNHEINNKFEHPYQQDFVCTSPTLKNHAIFI